MKHFYTLISNPLGNINQSMTNTKTKNINCFNFIITFSFSPFFHYFEAKNALISCYNNICAAATLAHKQFKSSVESAMIFSLWTTAGELIGCEKKV